MTQETNEVVIEESSQPEVQNIVIETVEQFGNLILQWHTQQVATIQHLMQIPEGIDVAIESEEPFALSGDAHTAFKLGLSAALDYFGKLPFSTTEEDAQIH